MCARHGAKRQVWRTNAFLNTVVWPTRVDASRRKSRGSSRRYDNRQAKANREVTGRCKSSGGPGGREPLAEQQLRRREAGWEGSCKQILGPRNTKRILRHRLGGRGGMNTRSPMAIRTEMVYMRRAHEEKVTRLTLGELPLRQCGKCRREAA